MGYLTRALIRRKWESNRRRDAVRLASPSPQEWRSWRACPICPAATLCTR